MSANGKCDRLNCLLGGLSAGLSVATANTGLMVFCFLAMGAIAVLAFLPKKD